MLKNWAIKTNVVQSYTKIGNKEGYKMRGGKREGSGRKPLEVKKQQYNRKVTEAEAQQLDELLKKLRNNS